MKKLRNKSVQANKGLSNFENSKLTNLKAILGGNERDGGGVIDPPVYGNQRPR